MRYFIIIIIIFCLFFSILFLNSCKIKGFTESLDSEEIQEEIPEPDQDPEKTADEDDQYIQTDPDNKDPEYKESDSDKRVGNQKIENDVMFYNSEVNFAFIYSQENPTLSSYPYSSIDYGSLSLSVSIDALEMLKGSIKENALNEREALKNGEFGPNTDLSFEPSKKVVKIGDVFVKDYLVLGRYGICDVAFDRKAVFYNNDYQVQITLSADKEKMQESMSEYFVYDELNCLEEKIWDFDRQDEFYNSLNTGQASGPVMEWYETFDDIMYLFQINDLKGTSAGYDRIIDKRYFEENLEENSFIDISYPQFQSAIIGGLDNSINKSIYDETVLFLIDDFKNEIISYEDEDIDLNFFLGIDYTIVTYDGKSISLCFDIYRYMGGAHGILYFKTINFNLEKMDLIELGDLFVDGYDYLGAISEYCREDLIKQMKEIGAQPDEHWIEDGTDPGSTDTFSNFLATPSGLIIKFPVYQVGPYAIGVFSVNIPYEHFEGNINPNSMIADYNLE